jgi:DNA-binding LacI/PurR family transcriptional regulator
VALKFSCAHILSKTSIAKYLQLHARQDDASAMPPLTTVRQDFDALGEAAVSALVDDSSGGGAVIPAQLVERASTAPRR